MIPVDQTLTKAGEGNCLVACVASILHEPIDSIPHFIQADDWWAELQRYLIGRGMFGIRIPYKPDDKIQSKAFQDGEFKDPIPNVYCILEGQRPKTYGMHAVVGQIIKNKPIVVHDPHPEKTGLYAAPRYMIFFANLNIPIDQCKFKGRFEFRHKELA